MGTKSGPVKAQQEPEDRGRTKAISGLGQRLERLLLARSQVPGEKISLQGLSKMLTVPLSTVKQWRYEDKISAGDAVLLARWAECSLDWLLDENRAEKGPGVPAVARLGLVPYAGEEKRRNSSGRRASDIAASAAMAAIRMVLEAGDLIRALERRQA